MTQPQPAPIKTNKEETNADAATGECEDYKGAPSASPKTDDAWLKSSRSVSTFLLWLGLHIQNTWEGMRAGI